MADTETALIVEVPEAEALVSEWRLKYDPVAALGIPAHITALFPFATPRELSDSVLDQLRSLCSAIEPFDYELTEIDQFPEAVWLRPSPDERFRSLTRSIWTAVPDFPPYGGRFPDSQPHLTVAKLTEAEQAAFVPELTAAIGARLPVSCAALALSVFESDVDGAWTRRHRLQLGITG